MLFGYMVKGIVVFGGHQQNKGDKKDLSEVMRSVWGAGRRRRGNMGIWHDIRDEGLNQGSVI